MIFVPLPFWFCCLSHSRAEGAAAPWLSCLQGLTHYFRTGRISPIHISEAFFFFQYQHFNYCLIILQCVTSEKKRSCQHFNSKFYFFTFVLIASHLFSTLNYLKDVSCGFHLQAVESEICSSNAGKGPAADFLPAKIQNSCSFQSIFPSK